VKDYLGAFFSKRNPNGSFLRNKIAGVYGVKTGFAIPVIVEEKVLMIMAFFTHDHRSYSSECLTLGIDSVINFLASKANLDKLLNIPILEKIKELD
jgi:hypothetical protein